MRIYRVLRWAYNLTGWAVFRNGAWAMLGHYVVQAQHAVESAEYDLEFTIEVVAEEAASLVKEPAT